MIFVLPIVIFFIIWLMGIGLETSLSQVCYALILIGIVSGPFLVSIETNADYFGLGVNFGILCWAIYWGFYNNLLSQFDVALLIAFLLFLGFLKFLETSSRKEQIHLLVAGASYFLSAVLFYFMGLIDKFHYFTLFFVSFTSSFFLKNRFQAWYTKDPTVPWYNKK